MVNQLAHLHHVLTAPIGGAWNELQTTAENNLSQVCAMTNHLTLFDVSVRLPTQIPVTGDGQWSWWIIELALLSEELG